MKRITEISICIFVIVGVAYGLRYVHSFMTDYFVASYDFSTYQKGPQAGDVIPVENLKNRERKEISEVYQDKLILLGIVDPECGACRVAKDQIAWIQEDIQAHDIVYVFASFTHIGTEEEFFKYTDSFGFEADSFKWTSPDPPPISLKSFVVPSHLLMDSKGKILGKFPGTNRDIAIRKRIAKQITKEVLHIKESLNSQ